MKSFHIKSILLGIGIGTILTAIISMIFMAGFNPNNVRLTDQEIIDRAKSLGMLEAKSVLAVSGTTDTKLESDVADNTTETKNDGITKKDSSLSEDKTNQDNATPPPKTPEPVIIITVVKGDTSEAVAEKLINAKIIADKKVFLDELTKMNLTMEINIGQYKVKKGMDIKQIIKLLTTPS